MYCATEIEKIMVHSRVYEVNHLFYCSVKVSTYTRTLLDTFINVNSLLSERTKTLKIKL